MNIGYHYRPCRHEKVNEGIMKTTLYTDFVNLDEIDPIPLEAQAINDVHNIKKIL